MEKSNFRIVRVSMLILVVATFSFAQAPPFVSTNRSQILTAFQAARGNWVANIAGYANSLFGALAVIEFAWSAVVMVLEKADLQSFTAALIRKIMWIGGFYMLLINEARSVPIIEGDMKDLLRDSKAARDTHWPDSPWVFNRDGARIKDFRRGWRQACIAAEVPDLNFHDLRRTAVRNMRRAGIPQVVRMKISGHKTDSMERRYNIVDSEDLSIAKELLERRMNAARVTRNVTTGRESAKQGNTNE